MGTFAGAPYLSMFSFNTTDEEIYLETMRLAEEGLIDPVENMREDSVLIFHGLLDSVVPWGQIENCEVKDKLISFIEQGERIKKFYDKLMNAEKVDLKNDLDSEHGFVGQFIHLKLSQTLLLSAI